MGSNKNPTSKLIKLPIKYKGKTFYSIREISRYHNVCDGTVRERLKKGLSIEKALQPTISGASGVAVPITLEGKTYRSRKAACEAYGIPEYLIAGRVKKHNWTLEEAFGIKVKENKYAQPDRGTKVTINNITYNNITELAEAYGLTPATVYCRMYHKGMSPEEAVSFGKVRGVTCYGKFYPSIAALAREYGIVQGTLVNRLGKEKLTPEQAVSKPVTHLDFVGEGKIYLITNQSTGKQYVGQTITTLESRLKGHFAEARKGGGAKGGLKDAMRNFPEEDFIIEEIDSFIKCRKELDDLENKRIDQYNTMAPNGYNLRQFSAFGGGQRGQEVKVFGKTFASHNEMCRFYKVKSNTIRNRLAKGHSLEEALTKTFKRHSISIEAFSQTFESVTECCRHFKISRSLLAEKLKNYPPEEAIKICQEARVGWNYSGITSEVVVFGKKYKNRVKACKANNHSLTTITWRIKTHGLTAEQALSIPSTDGTNKFELQKYISKLKPMQK